MSTVGVLTGHSTGSEPGVGGVRVFGDVRLASVTVGGTFTTTTHNLQSASGSGSGVFLTGPGPSESLIPAFDRNQK